jgi:hypothetical protein
MVMRDADDNITKAVRPHHLASANTNNSVLFDISRILKNN